MRARVSPREVEVTNELENRSKGGAEKDYGLCTYLKFAFGCAGAFADRVSVSHMFVLECVV